MNAPKLLLASILLSGAAVSAQAELVGGIGYGQLSDDGIDVGAVQGVLGWEIPLANSVSVTPELRVGVGIDDDNVGGVNVEVGTYYGFNLRLQLNAGENVYVFAQPSYVNLEFEASLAGVTVTDDDWEFGGGLGVGYKFTDSTGVELSYEDFDGTSIVGLGLRFNF